MVEEEFVFFWGVAFFLLLGWFVQVWSLIFGFGRFLGICVFVVIWFGLAVGFCNCRSWCDRFCRVEVTA